MMEELNLDASMDAIAETIISRPVEPEAVETPVAEPAQVEAPAEELEVAQATQTETIRPAEEAPVEPLTPPTSWKQDVAQQEWSKLPRSVQEEVMRREADFHKGLSEFKAKAETATPLLEAVQPFAQILQQHNIRPEQMVKNLLNAQFKLATGTPAQRVEMLQKIAADYGIEWGADTGMMDPEQSALQQRLDRLESDRANEIRQKTMAEVESFASAVGPEGQPLRPYFDELANDIVTLIQSGQAVDLQAAYDKAIWLNPVTRAKEIERSQKAAQAAATKAAEEARKAEAANVRTSPKAAKTSAPTGSMDDTLMDTLSAIKSRS